MAHPEEHDLALLPDEWTDSLAEARGGSRGGRPPKYPWDQWCDGVKAREVIRGRDYTCETTTFVQQFRRAAKRRGGQAMVKYRNRSMTAGPDTLLIWVVYPDGIRI